LLFGRGLLLKLKYKCSFKIWKDRRINDGKKRNNTFLYSQIIKNLNLSTELKLISDFGNMELRLSYKN